MTDLGLHGFGSRPDGIPWQDYVHTILDDLPPAFSTVWVSDHLQFRDEPEPDAWTLMTWLAATFPRLRVGSMVLSQSYRNPGLLGVMAATLQNVSEGRLILGLGAGWLEEEYRAYDFHYPSGGTRVAQLAETIELLKTLWTTSPATYHGQHYRLMRARCVPPETPIPVMVGTNGPKALGVTARLADWWVWDGPWAQTYRKPYERLRAECEAIGRPFEEITLVSELSVSLPEDPAGFEPYFEHSFYPGQVFQLVGPTPADVIREIETLVDVGVQHVALGFDDASDLRRFVAEVLPHVRLSPTS